MARNILILGASYGSLLGTKLLMAGHNVTLVCRKKTAELINRDGTEVRIKLRDEAVHRAIFSRDLPGKLDATEPASVDISRYDLVALAMQEPQYTNHTVRVLMVKIAAAGLPCLSIMNMPPLPYLKRIPALADMDLEEAYTNARVWERFKPGLVTLCSPDPQAFRPPEEAANVLHVGLPTNFKAAIFEDEKHNKLLRELEADIDAVKLDGHDVPVKLKVLDSLFVPLAKWSMLLTGNYRCITPHDPQSIRDAVHGDLKQSQAIYDHVDTVARRLGADPQDQVPFEKYAKAAQSLLKPSSAARAVASGAPFIERVDASRSYEVERRLHYATRPGFRIAELQISSTQRVPWHYHSEVQDTFYVIDGTIRIFTREPEEEVCLTAGQTYAVRPGRPHLVTNAGDTSAVFLVLQGIGAHDFVALA